MQPPQSGQMEALIHLIVGSLTNEDAAGRSRAEQQLLQLETQPGYCSLLLAVLANKSLEGNTRLMASICLKNTVERRWRKDITPEEKKHIKSALLLALDEDYQQVALQIAIVIGTIARSDYPSQWEELFPHLLGSIRGTDQMSLRSMMALSHVVKGQCSKRLMVERKRWLEVTPQLFRMVAEVWNQMSNQTLATLVSFAEGKATRSEVLTSATAPAHLVIFSLRIIKYLVRYSCDDLNSLPIQPFLQQGLHFLRAFSDCRKTLGEAHPLNEEVDRCLKLQGLIPRLIQEGLPHDFLPYLEAHVEFYHDQLQSYFRDHAPAYPWLERWIILCCLFLKSCIGCIKYKPIVARRASSEQEVAKIMDGHRILTSFFTSERLLQMCKFLIYDYFRISEKELQEWEEDPEEFIREAEMDSWRDNLKPCAENLFIEAVRKFSEGEEGKQRKLIPSLIYLVKEMLMAGVKNGGIEGILLMEACYHSLGLISFELDPHMEFATWYKEELEPLLHNRSTPAHKFVRRRVAWLLGEWVACSIPAEVHHSIYSSLLSLLEEDDKVVRVTGANALNAFISDLSFYPNTFIPFLQPMMGQLFRLLMDLEEIDSKLHVLKVISTFITQLDQEIKPYASQIVESLVGLWRMSQGHAFLQTSVVQILAELTKCEGILDSTLFPFIAQVVAYSTQHDQPQALYLMEVGLELWANALRHMPLLDQGQAALWPRLAQLIEHSFEHVVTCMKILEGYLLLGGEDFINSSLASIIKILATTIGHVKERGLICALKALDILLQLNSKDVPPHLTDLLQRVLFELLSGQVEGERAAVYYLSIFARLALQNLSFLVQFFEALSKQSQQNLLVSFLDVWLNKVDSIGEPHMHKLTALALCSFIPMQNSDVIARIPAILNVVGSTLLHNAVWGEGSDAQEEDEDGDVPPPPENSTAYVRASHSLYSRDPVTSTDLKRLCLQKLQETAAWQGEEQLRALLQNGGVDPVTIRTLGL